MSIKSFRKGQSTFTCRCCGRRTRDTGGEGGIELCAQCYELAGLENQLSDSPETIEDVRRDTKMYFAELTAKNISDDILAREFPTLWKLTIPAEVTAKETKAQAKARRAKARRLARKEAK